MNKKNLRFSMRAESHEDHWKSFTDIFATVCLMFFFIMVVFGVISTYVSNEATRLGDEAKAYEETLKVREVELVRLIAEYDELNSAYSDMERERAKLEADKKIQEMRLDDLLNQIMSLQDLQIANMQSAKADFDAIASYRLEMYKKIESKLNDVMADMVFFDEEKGTIIFNTDFLFAKSSSTVKPEYKQLLAKMKGVLFEIIDEYTDSSSDSLVRFEFFEIRGHTDMDSSGSSNRSLSTERANSIVNELLPDESTEESKYAQYFLTSGVSKFDPKEGTVKQQTEAQKEANRRVEIYIRFDDKDIEKAISDIANTLISNRVRQPVQDIEPGE